MVARKKLKRPLLSIPKGISETKGDRSILARAIERFAPFEGEWVNNDRSTRKLSKAFVEKLVDGVARGFNTNDYLEQIAPRYSEQIKYIEKLQTLVAALARHLQAGDAYTRVDLQHNGLQISKLLQAIKSANRTAAATQRALEHRRKKQGRSTKDRGGNTNIFKELQGPPAWQFVTDLLHIYEQLRPGDAKATEGGDFYCFVLEISEYATGEPEAYGKLEPWIKRLVKTTREENALSREVGALLNEMEQLPKVDEEPILKRRVEISRAITYRQDTILKLSEKTWPHFRPRFWVHSAKGTN